LSELKKPNTLSYRNIISELTFLKQYHLSDVFVNDQKQFGSIAPGDRQGASPLHELHQFAGALEGPLVAGSLHIRSHGRRSSYYRRPLCQPQAVRARLCTHARDWPWSCVRAHLEAKDDGLVDVRPVLGRVPRFCEFVANDPSTAKQYEVAEQAIRASERTGRA
jgi:hypothetical protein